MTSKKTNSFQNDNGNGKRPETLTIMESNQLLDVLLRDSGTYAQKKKGIRNYTIGLCMLDAGLRVGEVTKLRVRELYFTTAPVASIIISATNSKNNQERTIPTTQRLRSALGMLHRNIIAPGYFTTESYAFGFGAGCTPITPRQTERVIKSAALEAFGRPIHPHVLRHTFASRLMRTCNIRIVQELLGHRSIRSTQVYTHPNGDDLKKAIDTLEKPES